MNRDTAIDRIRNAKPGTTGARTLGDLGQQVGGVYDQAAASAERAYDEALRGYHDAIEAAEQTYEDARSSAEAAYGEAQRRADALAARGSRLYDETVKRGRAYGDRASRLAGDNKTLALLMAGGIGFVLALAFRRR